MNNNPLTLPRRERTMTEELKPCPFCGSGDICFDDAAMGHSLIFCGGCNLSTGEFPDDDAAKEWWNNRSPDQPPQYTGLTAEEETYAKREIAEACRWHDQDGIASDAPLVGLTDVERVAKAIGEVERSQCGGYPYEGDNPDLNPWLTENHRAFARAAIAAMHQQSIRAEEVERAERVQKWLDGGCSSWGVPASDIQKLLDAALLVSDRSGA